LFKDSQTIPAGSKTGKKFKDRKKKGRKTGGKTEKGKKFLEQRVTELERENSALQADMQRRDDAGSVRAAVVELAARVCEVLRAKAQEIFSTCVRCYRTPLKSIYTADATCGI
jgi:hypothetical protein